jgi:hypothetical protein
MYVIPLPAAHEVCHLSASQNGRVITTCSRKKHQNAQGKCDGIGPHLNLALKPRFLAYRHDFFGGTITAIVSLIRDRICLQLRPVPSTGNGWPAARTVESPFIRESGTQGQQVRPITVWTEADQISSAALRALDAMANTRCHGTYQSLYSSSCV